MGAFIFGHEQTCSLIGGPPSSRLVTFTSYVKARNSLRDLAARLRFSVAWILLEGVSALADLCDAGPSFAAPLRWSRTYLTDLVRKPTSRESRAGRTLAMGSSGTQHLPLGVPDRGDT
jgi:hypothetical protein